MNGMRVNKVSFLISITILFLFLGFFSQWSRAADAPTTGVVRGEKVAVDKLKEKYWAKGDESELKVVQNRTYSKNKKIELGLNYGTVSSDPFLTIKSWGGSLGFHLTENWSVHGLFWKYKVSASSALTLLETQKGTTANTNYPDTFMGMEAQWAPIYGKLSILDTAIIYFDFHAKAGAGQVKTETGTYVAPFLGLGQQVHLSKMFSLRLDYRFLWYKEDVPRKIFENKSTQNGIAGSRTSYNDVITLGLTAFISLF